MELDMSNLIPFSMLLLRSRTKQYCCLVLIVLLLTQLSYGQNMNPHRINQENVNVNNLSNDILHSIDDNNSIHHRHYHHHHHLHEEEDPTSSHNIIIKTRIDYKSKIYPKLSIHGFVNSQEERTCSSNLQRSDTNNDKKISPTEFTKFLDYQSNGTVKASSYTDLNNMFILIFLSTACLTCYEETADDGCCLGSKAHIPIDRYEGQNTNDTYLKVLFIVCVPVMEKIQNIIQSQQPATQSSSTPTIVPSSSTAVPQEQISSSTSPVPVPISKTSTPPTFTVPSSQKPSTITPSTTIPMLLYSTNPSSPTYQPTTKLPVSISPLNVPSSLFTTNLPTQVSSIQLSSEPTSIRTDHPSSSTPSHRPIQIPTFIPSYTPSSTPTDGPSVLPSSTPIMVESSSPSSTPTDFPSQMPSNTPTDAPSQMPFNTPTTGPSDMPSSAPRNSPSQIPSESPSTVPSQSSSSQPLATVDCVSFTYLLQGLNYTAADIMLGINNTIRQGLEQATRALTIKIFNETYSNRSRSIEGIDVRRMSKEKEFDDVGVDVEEEEADKTNLSRLYSTSNSKSVSYWLIRESSINIAFQKAVRLHNNSTSVQFAAIHNRSETELKLTQQRQDARTQLVSRRTKRGLDDQPIFQQRNDFQHLTDDRYEHITRLQISDTHPIQQKDKQQRAGISHRRLVYFSDAYPVNITRIIDFPMTSNITGIRLTGFIVASNVCYLVEKGDDATDIQTTLTSRLKQAFTNGEFDNEFPKREN